MRYYQAGGTLRANSPTYVSRKADTQLPLRLEEGEFCYVLTARQMGKSSLKVRVINQLREKGWNCVDLDLTSFGIHHTNTEQWYFSFLFELCDQLGIESEFEQWWEEQSQRSAVARFSQCWQSLVLPNVEGQIVVFIDEIDSLISLNKEKFSTDDFFAAIRAIYNLKASQPEYSRLNFCILGVAAPNDLMEDNARTPFNIGTPIQLRNFSEEEASPLLIGLKEISDQPEIVLREILSWTAGQPYLTQKLCLELGKIGPIEDPAAAVKQMVNTLFLNPGQIDTDANLSNVQNRILNAKDWNVMMLNCYQQVKKEGAIAINPQHTEQLYLKLSGLVRESGNRLVVNNRIYDRVFDEDWIQFATEKLEHPFLADMHRWEAQSHDESFLLYGAILDQARAWADRQPNLGPYEMRYLMLSQEANDWKKLKKNRRRTQLAVVIAIISLVGLAVSGYLYYEVDRSRVETIAANRQLEEQSDSLSKLNLELHSILSDRDQALTELFSANDSIQNANLRAEMATVGAEIARRLAELKSDTTELALFRADSLRTEIERSQEAYRLGSLALQVGDTNVALGLRLVERALQLETNKLLVEVMLTMTKDLNSARLMDRFNRPEFPVLTYAVYQDEVLIGNRNGTIIKKNISSGLPIDSFELHNEPVRHIEVLTLSRQREGNEEESQGTLAILSSGDDGRVLISRYDNGKLLAEGSVAGGTGILALKAIPLVSGDIAVACSDGSVRIMEYEGIKLAEKESFQPHSDWIDLMEYEPNSNLLLTASEYEGSIYIYDLDSIGSTYFYPKFDYYHVGVSSVRFSPNGTLLAIGREGGCDLYEMSSGSRIQEVNYPDKVRDINFSQTGDSIYLAGEGNIDIFTVENGERIRSFGFDGVIFDLSIMHNGNQMICLERGDVPGQMGGNLTRYNLPVLLDYEYQPMVAEHPNLGQYLDVAFTDQEDHFLLSWPDSGLTFHQTANYGSRRSSGGGAYIKEGGTVARILVNESQGLIINVLHNGLIVKRSLDNQEELARCEINEICSAISLSHEGDKAILGTFSGTIIVIDVNSFEEVDRFSVLNSRVTSICSVPGTDMVYVVSAAGDLKALSLRDGGILVNHSIPRTGIADVELSPRAGLCVSVHYDKLVRIWDFGNMSSESNPRQLVGHRGHPTAVAISGDGSIIATGSDIGEIKLWLTSTGEEIQSFSIDAKVHDVQFSPNGHLLMVNGGNQTISFWKPIYAPLDIDIPSLEDQLIGMPNEIARRFTPKIQP